MRRRRQHLEIGGERGGERATRRHRHILVEFAREHANRTFHGFHRAPGAGLFEHGAGFIPPATECVQPRRIVGVAHRAPGLRQRAVACPRNHGGPASALTVHAGSGRRQRIDQDQRRSSDGIGNAQREQPTEARTDQNDRRADTAAPRSDLVAIVIEAGFCDACGNRLQIRRDHLVAARAEHTRPDPPLPATTARAVHADDDGSTCLRVLRRSMHVLPVPPECDGLRSMR